MKKFIHRSGLVVAGAAIVVATLAAYVQPAHASYCGRMVKMYGTSEVSTRYHTVHLSNGTTKTISTNGVVTAPSGTYFDGVYTHSGYDVWVWNADDVVHYYSPTGWHYWKGQCFSHTYGTIDEQ